MKTPLVLALVPVAALVACGGDNPPPAAPAPTATTPPPAPTPTPTPTVETPPPAPKPPMAELQKKTLTAMAAAFNASDAKKEVEGYAADAVTRMPGKDGWKESHGRDEILKREEELFANVDAKETFTRVLQSGDAAVLEFVGSGTDKKSGKKVAFRGASAMWFDADGLVKREDTYYDEASIAMQLGMIPGKARDVVAPTGDAQWLVSKSDDAEKKTIDFVKNSWPVAFAKKDKKAWDGMIVDGYVHEEIAAPVDFKGRADAAKEFDMFMKAFPDMAVSVDNAWGAGDVVALEFTFKATQKGPFGPIAKPTNKPFAIHGLEFNEVKDGKLVKSSTYTNSIELLSQLGLLPAKKDEKKDDKKPAPPPPAKK